MTNKHYLSTTRPLYGGGGTFTKVKDWYDNSVSQDTKDVLSFVPFLGTVIDGIEMMEHPNLVNGVGLAASAVTDLLGGKALYKLGKAAYKAYKARKTVRAIQASPNRLANLISYRSSRAQEAQVYQDLLIRRIQLERARAAAIKGQKADAFVNLGQVSYNRYNR